MSDPYGLRHIFPASVEATAERARNKQVQELASLRDEMAVEVERAKLAETDRRVRESELEELRRAREVALEEERRSRANELEAVRREREDLAEERRLRHENAAEERRLLREEAAAQIASRRYFWTLVLTIVTTTVGTVAAVTGVITVL